MPFHIIWSPRSRLTYLYVLEYLEKEWTAREVEQFMLRTEEAIDFIKANPKLYPWHKDVNAYKCVLVKQVSLFYRIWKGKIELLVFWDNRQDLKRLVEQTNL